MNWKYICLYFRYKDGVALSHSISYPEEVPVLNPVPSLSMGYLLALGTCRLVPISSNTPSSTNKRYASTWYPSYLQETYHKLKRTKHSGEKKSTETMNRICVSQITFPRSSIKIPALRPLDVKVWKGGLNSCRPWFLKILVRDEASWLQILILLIFRL